VVVIPFFVILFAAVVFVGQAYSEKERVMRESKEKVWSYAMANCGEHGDVSRAPSFDPSGIVRGAESNGDNGGADMREASNAAGAPHSDVIEKDVGSAAIRLESTVSASELLGGTRATQASYRKVMCNEPAYDGDVVGTMKAAYHDVTGW
jgi:hypothetical protein